MINVQLVWPIPTRVVGALTLLFIGDLAAADSRYSPGANDNEIRIGQTMPYSGPTSSYSTIGKVQSAYFAMINQHGGINGRKITFLSVDDSYSPPKTVEQVR